jgi:hypothetical protein
LLLLPTCQLLAYDASEHIPGEPSSHPRFAPPATPWLASLSVRFRVKPVLKVTSVIDALNIVYSPSPPPKTRPIQFEVLCGIESTSGTDFCGPRTYRCITSCFSCSIYLFPLSDEVMAHSIQRSLSLHNVSFSQLSPNGLISSADTATRLSQLNAPASDSATL